jgi:glutamine synthetase
MARVPLAGTSWIPGQDTVLRRSGPPLRHNGTLGSELWPSDLAATPRQRGIKYFLISFTDLFGVQRAKLVPAAAIDEMQKAGAGFAGFATWLDMTPADPDMFAVPDPAMPDPAALEAGGRLAAADPWMNGKPVEQAPRNVLKRLIAEGRQARLQMKTGVECEFFLLTPTAMRSSDAADTQEKPCYDQQALMRRYDVITEICDAMLRSAGSPTRTTTRTRTASSR